MSWRWLKAEAGTRGQKDICLFDSLTHIHLCIEMSVSVCVSNKGQEITHRAPAATRVGVAEWEQICAPWLMEKAAGLLDWWPAIPISNPPAASMGPWQSQNPAGQKDIHPGCGETGKQPTKLESAYVHGLLDEMMPCQFSPGFSSQSSTPGTTSTTSGGLPMSPEKAAIWTSLVWSYSRYQSSGVKSFRRLSSISGFQEKSFTDHAFISH